MKYIVNCLLALCVFVIASPVAVNAAEPTDGGAGGQIVRVTTLAKDGPGSLADALDREGPRIIAAGVPLSIIGGHGDVTGFREDVHAILDQGYTCTGAVECAEKVRKASRAGADVIKITATGGVLSQQGRGLGAHFSNDELVSIADTAHSLGLKVMAHAHGERGIEAAAAAGIDSIEHGTFADDAALKVMKAKGTYLVPTLMAFEGVRERLGKGIYTPTVEEKVRMTLGRVGQMENEIGRIAPGMSADMIAVDGDPLGDVTTLEHVRWVMARGRIAD